MTLIYNKDINYNKDIKELPTIYGIIGELKYRLVYIGLAVMSLLALIYLNLGLYIEFQGSYYLSYYQFIDFNWYEGVKELNQSVVSSLSRDPIYNFAVFGQEPLSARLSLIEDEIAAQLSYSKLDIYNFSAEYSSFVSNLKQCNNNGQPEELKEPITIEIDEFKNFFISIVSYFSGQIKVFIDLSESNTTQLLEKQNSFYSQAGYFGIYAISLFYQLIALFCYHCFCFLGPATLKQSRLKLFQGLQFIFATLLLHFLSLPYVITIYEEFQIESLDSELCYFRSFNLLNSWVHCFYFLLFIIVLLLLFFSYGYSLFLTLPLRSGKYPE